MSSSDHRKRKRTARTSNELDEPVERRNEKRVRFDVEDEKKTVKLELEEAKKELNEAEKTHDTAEVKQDAAKAERDSYLEAFLAEQDPDRRAAIKISLDEAESDLKTAESALDTAQSDIDACQRALSRLIDPYSAVVSTSLHCFGGQRSSKRVRSGESTAPQSVQDFWFQLGDAKVEETGKKLQLNGGTFFIGDSDLMSSLYVREHYKKLLEQILDLAKNGLRRTVILGTPGIGKTYFLYWLLWKLRKDLDISVVLFETQDEGYRFGVDGTVKRRGSVRAFRDDLEKPNCWYLVDGVEPIYRCHGITVLSTTPDRKIWYHFAKQKKAYRLFLPLFTKEEMLECQRLCFPKVKEGVDERFDKYGGVARAVLDVPQAEEEEMMGMFDEGPSFLPIDFNPTDLYHLGSMYGREDWKVVHRILHIDVTDLEKYARFEYKFASSWVEQQVIDKFWRGKVEDVRDFVRATAAQPTMAQIRGLAFEELAHGRLCQGGTFRVRSLETPAAEVQQDEWERMELVRFRRLDEVPSIVEKGNYACPVDKNLPAVDAVAGESALQMTVSLKHLIKGDKLDKLLNVVDVERLVFVVPADQFEAFRKQKIEGGRNAESLDQYVLEIPL